MSHFVAVIVPPPSVADPPVVLIRESAWARDTALLNHLCEALEELQDSHLFVVALRDSVNDPRGSIQVIIDTWFELFRERIHLMEVP